MPVTFCCIHKLTLTVVLLYVVLMLTIGITWLVINSCNPGFRLTSFFIANFTVSDYKLTGDELPLLLLEIDAASPVSLELAG